MSEVAAPQDPSGRAGGSGAGSGHSTAGRAVLWLLAGLGAGLLAVLATAPELLAAPGAIRELLAIVLVGAVPGSVILAVVAWRRRRTDRES